MGDEEPGESSDEDFNVTLDDPNTPTAKNPGGAEGLLTPLGSGPPGLMGQTLGSAGPRGRTWSRTGAPPLAARPTLPRADGYVPGQSPATPKSVSRTNSGTVPDVASEGQGGRGTQGAPAAGDSNRAAPERAAAPPPPPPQYELPEAPWNGPDGPLLGRCASHLALAITLRLLLHFTGPPVPITARVHPTPQMHII
eukprot:9489971-Pyramimonas_sp.AAC.1